MSRTKRKRPESFLNKVPYKQYQIDNERIEFTVDYWGEFCSSFIYLDKGYIKPEDCLKEINPDNSVVSWYESDCGGCFINKQSKTKDYRKYINKKRRTLDKKELRKELDYPWYDGLYSKWNAKDSNSILYWD